MWSVHLMARIGLHSFVAAFSAPVVPVHAFSTSHSTNTNSSTNFPTVLLRKFSFSSWLLVQSGGLIFTGVSIPAHCIKAQQRYALVTESTRRSALYTTIHIHHSDLPQPPSHTWRLHHIAVPRCTAMQENTSR